MWVRWRHRLARWIDEETFAGIGYTSDRERLFDWETLTMTLRPQHWMCECGNDRRRYIRGELLWVVKRNKAMANLARRWRAAKASE